MHCVFVFFNHFRCSVSVFLPSMCCGVLLISDRCACCAALTARRADACPYPFGGKIRSLVPSEAWHDRDIVSVAGV